MLYYGYQNHQINLKFTEFIKVTSEVSFHNKFKFIFDIAELKNSCCIKQSRESWSHPYFLYHTSRQVLAAPVLMSVERKLTDCLSKSKRRHFVSSWQRIQTRQWNCKQCCLMANNSIRLQLLQHLQNKLQKAPWCQWNRWMKATPVAQGNVKSNSLHPDHFKAFLFVLLSGFQNVHRCHFRKCHQNCKVMQRLP